MRLVDIDSLKGCAIILPTSSEEIAHIQACKGFIAHKDIPTAYDVEAKVAELEKESFEDSCGRAILLSDAERIVRGKE